MTPSTGLRNKPIRFAVSDRGTWNEHSGRDARIFIPISGASYLGFAACFYTQRITNYGLTFGIIFRFCRLILGLCRLLLIRFGSLFAEPFRGDHFRGAVSWGGLFGIPFRYSPFRGRGFTRGEWWATFGEGEGFVRGGRSEGGVPGHVAILLLMVDGESAVGHGGDDDACYYDDVTHICCFSFPTH